MFLDFVHHLMFLEKTTFRKLAQFPSSGKIMATLDQRLRLAPSKGPNRVGAFIILPEDGNVPVTGTVF
jgi:hypothetical protein